MKKTRKTEQLRVRVSADQRKLLESLAGPNDNLSDVVRRLIDQIRISPKRSNSLPDVLDEIIRFVASYQFGEIEPSPAKGKGRVIGAAADAPPPVKPKKKGKT